MKEVGDELIYGGFLFGIPIFIDPTMKEGQEYLIYNTGGRTK